MERNKYPLAVLSLVLLSLQPFNSSAQVAPTIEWTAFVTENSLAYVSDVAPAPDGGYIAAGSKANGTNGMDFFIQKIDPDGLPQWHKFYGGTGDDQAYALVASDDGGFLVVGRTSSNDGHVTGNHGNDDIWVVKINAEGELQWQRCYGGPAYDHPSSVIRTPSGYAIVGTSTAAGGDVSHHRGWSDIWVISIDEGGSLFWESTYGGSADDQGSSILRSSDGNYTVCGHTRSTNGNVSHHIGDADAWVLKLSDTGMILWERTFGGSGRDVASVAHELPDGGYMVVGQTRSTDGDVSESFGLDDAWILKLTSTGELDWERSFGGTGIDWALDLDLLPDDDVLVVGSTASLDGDFEGTHGGTYDQWLMRLDLTGEVKWKRLIGGSGDDRTTKLLLTDDGGCLVSGLTNSTDGDAQRASIGYRGWLVKFHPDEVGMLERKAPLGFRLAPNPVQDRFAVLHESTDPNATLITIHDAAGRQVMNARINGMREPQVSVVHLVPGLYHAVISANDGSSFTLPFVKD